jgi:NAD(P)-dependent dehydrogenase (short-subunit alcohol dehydrogenase family)
MEQALSGKTALVTGGSRGIGAQIARTLAAKGATVAVHYSASKAEAEAVAAEIASAGGKAFTVGGDLSQTTAIGPMFEQLDAGLKAQTGDTGLDILVNNAGRGGGGPLGQSTEADFDAVFGLNVKGLFFVTQAAAPRLRENGRVVNISSLVARGAQAPRVIYAASKWAVNGLTVSFAQEFAPRRITVNAVSPGAVATDLIAGAMQNPEFEKMVVKGTAFGRVGQPKDIADVVGFLCSPEAGWVTGQVIEATGGARL